MWAWAKTAKDKRHQAELQKCGRPRQIHQCPAARRGADQRRHALHRGDQQGEHEREMADLYQHLTAYTGPHP